MNRLVDMVGKQVAELFVVVRAPNTPERDKRAYWWCLCSCGEWAVVRGTHLRSGKTKSCGCLMRKSGETHGMHNTAEYTTWINMKMRAGNRDGKRPAYTNVAVCDWWVDAFEAFYEDMGPRPPKHHTDGEYSLDRINPYGDYEPSNCRWATDATQRKNRRIDFDRAANAAFDAALKDQFGDKPKRSD